MVNLATLSDDEILAMSAATQAKPTDLSLLSDDELLAMAGSAPEPEAPTTGELWANRARGVGAGVENTLEFGADLADIALAPISGMYEGWNKNPESGFVDRAMDAWGQGASNWVQEATPWGESTDSWREENLYKHAEPLTKNTIEHDPVRTGIEFGTEAVLTGGRNMAKNAMSSASQAIGATVGDWVDDGTGTGAVVGSLAAAVANPVQYLTKTIAKLTGKNASELSKIDQMALDVIAPEGPVTDINTPQTREQRVRKNIVENYESGQQGTVADLAGDEHLYQLEASLGTSTAGGRAVAKQVRRQQQQASEEFTEAFGEGDVSRAVDDAELATDAALRNADEVARVERNLAVDNSAALVDEKVQNLNRQQDSIQKSIDQQQVALGGKGSASASDDLSAGIDTLTEELKDVADKKWKGYSDAAENIDGEKISEAVTEELSKLNPFRKKRVSGSHSGIIDDALDLGKRASEKGGVSNVTPEEVTDVISTMKQDFEVAKLANGGKARPQDLVLKDIQKKLEDVFEETVPDELRGLYTEAKQATKTMYARTQPKAKGQTRKSYIGDTKRAKGDSELYDALTSGKGKSAAIAQELKEINDPRITQSFEDMLLSNPEVITKKWVADRSGFFKEFPEMKTKVDKILVKNSVLKQTMKQRDDLGKAAGKAPEESGRVLKRTLADLAKEEAEGLTAIEGLPLSRYAKNQTETLNKALDSPETGAATLKAIASKVDNAGFNRNLGNIVKERLQSELGNADTGFKDAAQTGWRKMEPMLKEVFGEASKEYQAARKAVTRAEADFYRKNAAQMVREISGSGSKDLLVNVLSATIASSLPGTHTLMYGGRIRQFISNMPIIKQAGLGARSEKRVEQLLASPKEMTDLIKRAEAASKNAIKGMTLKEQGAHISKVFAIELNDYLEGDNAYR